VRQAESFEVAGARAGVLDQRAEPADPIRDSRVQLGDLEEIGSGAGIVPDVELAGGATANKTSGHSATQNT
jgi:hypothetical protein